MNITICTNTETLRPIWGDIYDNTGFHDSHDWDESIAAFWVKTVAANLPAHIGYDYESAFEFWNGGFGCGVWHSGDVTGKDYDACLFAITMADNLAREAAESDITAMA